VVQSLRVFLQLRVHRHVLFDECTELGIGQRAVLVRVCLREELFHAVQQLPLVDLPERQDRLQYA
jgi:hypothetical protein